MGSSARSTNYGKKRTWTNPDCASIYFVMEGPGKFPSKCGFNWPFLSPFFLFLLGWCRASILAGMGLHCPFPSYKLIPSQSLSTAEWWYSHMYRKLLFFLWKITCVYPIATTISSNSYFNTIQLTHTTTSNSSTMQPIHIANPTPQLPHTVIPTHSKLLLHNFHTHIYHPHTGTLTFLNPKTLQPPILCDPHTLQPSQIATPHIATLKHTKKTVEA